MKKLKDHIKWIILILLVVVISIILVGCLYVRKGYCLAWDVDLDYVATDTFVGILALICTNAVALITAILYYSSLKEQQKQTFNSQWQGMLERQLKIRDEQKVNFKLLNNRWKEVTILIEGYRCMIMTDILYRDLTQAIQSKYNYTDRDNLKHEHDETEAILREMDEEYRLEQEYLMRYNPKEYKRQMDDASYKRRISMVGNLFNIQGTEVGDAKLLAFEMIYKKYFSQTSTYFTHIVSLLVFLERQSYNYSSSEIKECAQNLCDNLTYCEKELLLQYAEYHPNSKKIINQYIKF